VQAVNTTTDKLLPIATNARKMKMYPILQNKHADNVAMAIPATAEKLVMDVCNLSNLKLQVVRVPCVKV